MHRAEQMRSRAGTSRRRLLRCLTALAAVGALALPASASANHTYATRSGASLGAGRASSTAPAGSTRTRLDNVYVADFGNHRDPEVQPRRRLAGRLRIARHAATANSTIRSTWPWTAMATSGSPTVATTASRSSTPAAASSTSRADVAAPGTGNSTLPSRSPPTPPNNVYVADYGNHRVQKFDSDRGLRPHWGSPGTGDGQFDYPSGIAVAGTHSCTSPTTATTACSHFTTAGASAWPSSGAETAISNGPDRRGRRRRPEPCSWSTATNSRVMHFTSGRRLANASGRARHRRR